MNGSTVPGSVSRGRGVCVHTCVQHTYNMHAYATCINRIHGRGPVTGIREPGLRRISIYIVFRRCTVRDAAACARVESLLIAWQSFGILWALCDMRSLGILEAPSRNILGSKEGGLVCLHPRAA